MVRREEGLRLEARGAAGMTLRLVELGDALLALVVRVVVSVGVRVVACRNKGIPQLQMSVEYALTE